MAVLATLGLAGMVRATLIDNLDGTITQIRNDGSMLMWLKDANYAKTSGYHADGRMLKYEAQAFINNLNSNTYLGYDDWRLPEILPVNGNTYNSNLSYDGSSDAGWNITSTNSEMAYMYYVELGNKGYCDISSNCPQDGWGLSNTGPFTNLEPGYYYSDNETYPGSVGVWSFAFNGGRQIYDTAGNLHAWAVRLNYSSTFTITPSTGVGGDIAPSTPQTVNHGATTSFLITPDANYHINTVTGCSGTLSGNTYTTAPVTADCAVTTSFAIDTHTVTPSAGANGSISPSTQQTINHGGTTSFSINPDIGYYVSNVTGTCDGTLSGNTFTTDPVTSNCTVNAIFTLNTYTVTPFAEGDGSIAPPSPQTINHGSTTTFTVTPDEGYTSFVGGTCAGILDVTTYTTNTITSNCTVIANFGINMYLVNAPERQHGTIAPYGEIFVNHGEILIFTLTPDDDYRIGEVIGCDGTLTDNIYTTGDITGSCEVTTTFTKDSFPWAMFLPAIISAQ